MPAFKLSVPAFSLSGLFGRGGRAQRLAAHDPLPPLLVVEGAPDPSLATIIAGAAERLGAEVCPIDRLADLVRDPDLAAVVGLVLTRPRAPRDWNHVIHDARAIVGDVPVAVVAPQPTSLTLEAALPLDPAFVAPPVTVDRLLFALGVGSGVRA